MRSYFAPIFITTVSSTVCENVTLHLQINEWLTYGVMYDLVAAACRVKAKLRVFSDKDDRRRREAVAGFWARQCATGYRKLEDVTTPL